MLVYRQFDFWIGEWEAFGVNGKKAGDSKISVILDSCIILEEWTSANMTQGIRYAGKSFNTYNNTTKQWQQTWVDNVGGSTEYLAGKYENKKITFLTSPFPDFQRYHGHPEADFLRYGKRKSKAAWRNIKRQWCITGSRSMTLNTGEKNNALLLKLYLFF